MSCSIDGCSSRVIAGGLCMSHYRQSIRVAAKANKPKPERREAAPKKVVVPNEECFNDDCRQLIYPGQGYKVGDDVCCGASCAVKVSGSKIERFTI